MFKLNQLVAEKPDENKESRWEGRIVGFSKVTLSPQRLLVIALTRGHYMDNGIFVSLLLVHPDNAELM